MVLLPAVIDAIADPNFPVVGAGGFCDGKTLAAAIAMGAAGVQMGTRLLATEESDFHPLWKEQVVKTGDRGTLVARGFVGPARWLKTPSSEKHLQNTLAMSPGVFTGIPDDMASVSPNLIQYERDAIQAVCEGNEQKAMMAGGECAQRVNDMPKVKDIVDKTIKEATDIIKNINKTIK